MSDPAGIMNTPLRARGGVHRGVIGVHRGTPDDEERQRLAGRFGATVTAELRRRNWRVGDLAQAAGIHRNTVSALVHGRRRPTTNMTWRLAKAFRSDELGRVELDVRLRVLAGDSLVRQSRRLQLRRERLAAEVLARGGPAVHVELGQDFDAYLDAVLNEVPA